VLTNGKNVGGRAGDPSAPGALDAGAETYDVEAGQGLRLRLGNTATIRFFRLRLTDNAGTQIPLVRIGGQGGLLDSAVVEGGVIAGFDTKIDSGEIQLDPGDRQDVVAAIPSTATGVLTLWTLDMSRTGLGFSNIPTVPVAHFNVVGAAGAPYTIANGTPLRAATGDPVPVIGAPTGTLLNPAAFAPPKPGMSAQNIELRSGPNIDGVTGSHDFPGDYTLVPQPDSTRYAKLGDTLELTVTNTSAAHHPFHLHGFSIQPISLVDSDPTDSDGTKPPYTWPYHEFRDNIDVPPLYTLRFRVKLDDRALMDGVTPGGGLGRWVFHCHIFFHATLGMISEFDVVAADGNERPYVNASDTSLEVDEGQLATLGGTSHDPDGDAVTFAASLGTVSDGGGGNWTWDYTTTDGPTESGLVYVTATDAGGRKDQAVFALTVNNVAPAVAISSPANGSIVQLATPFPLTAPFSDPGTGDTHTCSIDWGDGVTEPGVVAEAAGSGSCTGSHAYATAGFKTITVTVTDDDGGVAASAVIVDVNSPPDCTPVVPTPNSLWPPNHGFQVVSLSGATDPDGDTVTLTVTGVTQDEPLNAPGDGNTTPDGQLVPGHSEQVGLRAERSGKGDGRVYRISFGGSDGRGGTCSGTKPATVVHSKGHGSAIDSGLVVNSLF
jgi:FtsP/CotA-like multicopper oxidase with cupredoxin domain